MRDRALAISFGLLACGVAAACSSSSRSGFVPDPPATVDAGASEASAPTFSGQDTSLVAVTMRGTVYAPNGSLPLSNALVYFTSKEPDPIPQQAYCDECVKLTEGTFTVSGPDGTFELETQMPLGKQYLVVQKGQFRRVRQIEVEKAGTLKIDRDDSTLPGRANLAKGDDVPRMVVLKDDAAYDRIDESLTKLGITGFEVKNDRRLLENATDLMSYHVVFVPCGASDDPISASSTAKANVQAFVQAGGKLYVTDWSYEFVRQPFSGFLSWEGENAQLGSGASGDEWDAPATAVDQGLADWLSATGDPTFTVQGNWTTIASVNARPGKDPKGQDTTITPKVWVTGRKQNGQDYPTTVSFEDQCGRVLFSTYHTESGFGGSTSLLAQEKALLYVLLEIGVCAGERPGVR
jgi:hypothetical protein